MEEKENENNIRRTDIYNIHFYESAPFYGSFRGMCYRIARIEEEEDAPQLCVTTWPGPYNFETTDDDLKTAAFFPFSNEGLDEITGYLNQYYREHFRKTDQSPT